MLYTVQYESQKKADAQGNRNHYALMNADFPRLRDARECAREHALLNPGMHFIVVDDVGSHRYITRQ